jgi:hypothetical protein
VNFAVWNPQVCSIAGGDEDRWAQVDRIIKALSTKTEVTDLGGGCWRVMDINAPTQELAAQEVERMLGEIDPAWPEALQVAPE